MTNPAMPNLPGFGSITETMDLVRKMWGGMGSNGASAPGIGIPGMVMPSLSVEDINKQIADLKAVESWLTLNMNMLRGTIQALEVQSATISTLKTMSETFSAAVKPAADAGGKTPSAFGFPFGGAVAAAPAPAAPAPVAPRAVQVEAPAPQPEANAPSGKTTKPENDKAGDGPAPGMGAPIANPAAWWNMLQDQFKHAVSTAMAPEAGGKTGSTPAANTAERPAEKTTAKSGATAPAKPAAKSAVLKNAALPIRKAVAKRAVKSAPRQR